MANKSNNGCLWALLILLLCPWLIVMIPIVFGFMMGIFGIGMGLFGAGVGVLTIVPMLLGSYLSDVWIHVLMACFPIAILLPLGYLIYLVIRLILGHGFPEWKEWVIMFLIWLFALIGTGASVSKAIHEAGGLDALKEQLSNQTQVWEYDWNSDNTEDEN